VKSQPGEMNYASTGTGSPPHLATELLKIAAGIDMAHIPYNGGVPALTVLIAGGCPCCSARFRRCGSGRLRGST